VKIRPHAAAQIFRLADIDDLPLGVLVEVHARIGGEGAYFLEEVHWKPLYFR
jgi:hypothetical protein